MELRVALMCSTERALSRYLPGLQPLAQQRFLPRRAESRGAQAELQPVLRPADAHRVMLEMQVSQPASASSLAALEQARGLVPELEPPPEPAMELPPVFLVRLCAAIRGRRAEFLSIVPH